MTCAEYRQLVAGHADDRLDAAEAGDAAAHVASCPGCLAAFRAQGTAKELLRAHKSRYTTPVALRQRVVEQIDTLDRSAAEGQAGRPLIPRRVLVLGTMAAGAAFALTRLVRSREASVLAILAADVHAAEADKIPLAFRTDRVDELRQFYRQSGAIDFERSVDDFSAMGLQLVGGSVREMAHVHTTFTVYNSPYGKLVCRRFRAGTIALPTGGERLGQNELFSVDGVTIVIMPLGEVVCCMSTTMPRYMFTSHLMPPEPA